MKRFQIFLVAVLLMTLSFGFGKNGGFEDKTLTSAVSSDFSLSIDAKRMSSNSMLVAPFRSENIFISEVIEAEFPFTSVGGEWEQFTPENTAVQVQVRFRVNNDWENWIDVETEDDQDQSDKKDPLRMRKYTFASTNLATAMQYKFILLGDGVNSPHVESPKWTFIKSAEAASSEKVAAPQYGNSLQVSNVRNLAVNSATNGIIPRSKWGANESLRYQTITDDGQQGNATGDDAAKDATVSPYALELSSDTSGKKYSWPLQYPYKVDRFVIHHTATSSNLDNPEQAIRDIYHYHAVTRGWGDIGYNYVIDRNGNIYEGRYGGEGVVAGHALGANNGSIGIAVLGNYENGEVPEAVINALGRLVGDKAKIHNINVNGVSPLNGKVMNNVIAHRDVASTACPGTFLYEKLPIIKSLASQTQASSSRQSGNAYDFNNLSGVQYITMDPGEVRTLEISLANIGRQNWSSNTKLIVANESELRNKIEISGGVLKENGVERGKQGSFSLTLRALGSGEVFYPRLRLKVDDRYEAVATLEIPIIVKNVVPTYELVDFYYPPVTMQHGETFSGWVKLKNTGSVTWSKSGANQVSLKTAREYGRASEFLRFGSDTLGYLREREVKPGEVGTFNLNLVAPSKTGSYKEHFVPFISGIGYLKDDGMNFAVNVYNSGNGDAGHAEVLKVYSKAEWTRNRSYSVSIKVMNETNSTWTANSFDLDITANSDIAIRNKKMTPASVEPGKVATLSFVAKPDLKAKLGDGKVLIMPKVSGKNLYNKSLEVSYTVVDIVKNTVSTPPVNNGNPSISDPVSKTPVVNNLGDFRVKLGFKGNPEISADGGFKLYDGAKLVQNLKAGDVAKVSIRGNDYKVEIGSNVKLLAGPVRFVADAGVVMQINNYEKRPEWNPSINDNIFIGTLEVNREDFNPIVINELPLEDYLKGLGEVSNHEPTEKIKAVMIAARTYAVFYMTEAEKFRGKPYHLNDDPENSQIYLGYGLTKRSPNVVAGVDATRGQVVTFNGKLVKTPYFSHSDGNFTKSAQEVWGWTDTPYLVSVSDSYCDKTSFYGHGVGMSGCGAKGMAEAGKTYEEILSHYYKGTKVTRL